MKEYKTHIDNNGRIFIPAKIRKDFAPDETFIVRVIDGEIHLVSKQKIIHEIQAWAKDKLKDNNHPGVTDHFLEVRKSFWGDE